MKKRESSKQTPILWISFKRVRQWVVSLCLLFLIIVVMTIEIPVLETGDDWSIPLSGQIITIDAGHGGVDAGAVRQGLIEKDINLSIALLLRDYLQQAGAVIVMTREGDYDLADPNTKGYSHRKSKDLKRRVHLVEKNNAHMLISLHVNSAPSSRWRGAQTFYKNIHPKNKKLAHCIQSEIRYNLNNTDREAQIIDRKLYLLDHLSVPAVLIEVGFLSNREELRNLANKEYQQKVAASIYKGILRYMVGEKNV